MGSIGKLVHYSGTVTTLGTVLTIGDYSFSRGDIEDTDTVRSGELIRSWSIPIAHKRESP